MSVPALGLDPPLFPSLFPSGREGAGDRRARGGVSTWAQGPRTRAGPPAAPEHTRGGRLPRAASYTCPAHHSSEETEVTVSHITENCLN